TALINFGSVFLASATLIFMPSMIAIIDGHIKATPTRYADRECVDFSISEQFFAQHQASPDSHPSYRHEEPASPTTCITLLTGGLLVRIQPGEPHIKANGINRHGFALGFGFVGH